MSKQSDKIYKMLSGGDLTAQQVTKRLGCSLTSARLYLSELDEQGRAFNIKGIGRNPDVWRAVPMSQQSKELKLLTSKWDASLELSV